MIGAAACWDPGNQKPEQCGETFPVVYIISQRIPQTHPVYGCWGLAGQRRIPSKKYVTVDAVNVNVNVNALPHAWWAQRVSN